MQQHVVVTHIDDRHIDLAKQLFSCMYHHADWQGDFLLLCHGVSDYHKKWFSDRHIIARDTPFLYQVNSCPAFSASKLYIFSDYLKNWNKVIYLDPDMIVRASINKLLSVKTFGAVPELDQQPLLDQLQLRTNSDWEILHTVEKKMHRHFNLASPSFNAGVLAFDTKILEGNLFNQLERLLHFSKDICLYADQTVLNLFFYDRWERLSRIYNLHPLLYKDVYRVPQKKILGINLHFSGMQSTNKPNHPDNPYYSEWKKNLEIAEFIGNKRVHTGPDHWSDAKVWRYERFLILHRLVFAPWETRMAPFLARYRIAKRQIGETFPSLLFLRHKITSLLSRTT